MMVDNLLGRVIRNAARRTLAFEPVENATGLPVPVRTERYMLYLHVPFCPSLCPFCSFHRVQFRRDQAARYFRALADEIALAADAGFRFEETYIGGGTPTVLPEALAELIVSLRTRYGVTRVSAETNPNDLVPEVLDRLTDAGVNRLSVGVQSLDDALLTQMRRREKYGDSAAIRERLQAAAGRFDTLNVDMMFNFPAQTGAKLERDLEILTDDIGASQVSWYPLMSSRSTRRTMAESIGRVSYARERAMYRQIAEHMLSRGYSRSSAWCFSKSPAMIDEYITQSDDYLGLGSGSFSLVGGTLYGSTFSIDDYLSRIADGRSGILRRRRLSDRERMQYHLLVRLFAGALSLDAADRVFERRFGRTLLPEIAGLRAIGAVSKTGRTLRLTESGQYLWVMLMREFFSSVNEFRERMRRESASAIQ